MLHEEEETICMNNNKPPDIACKVNKKMAQMKQI